MFLVVTTSIGQFNDAEDAKVKAELSEEDINVGVEELQTQQKHMFLLLFLNLQDQGESNSANHDEVIGVIHTIVGGFVGGGSSRSAQRGT